MSALSLSVSMSVCVCVYDKHGEKRGSQGEREAERWMAGRGKDE